jgi:hypothetical protein
MYIGDLELSLDNVSSILHAAELLLIDRLKNECVTFLEFIPPAFATLIMNHETKNQPATSHQPTPPIHIIYHREIQQQHFLWREL